MFIGLIYAITSAFMFGISNVIAKKSLQNVNMFQLMTIRSFFTLLTLIPFLFFTNFILPSLIDGIMIILIGVIGAVAYYLFVKAFSITDISVVSALTRTSVLITVLLSIIFLGESLQLLHYIAMLIVLLGIFLITADLKSLDPEKLLHEKKAMMYIAFCIILWGFMYFLLKYSVNSVGAIYTAFYLELFVFLFLLPIFFKHSSDIFQGIKKNNLFILFLIGSFTALGTLFYSYAISMIYVSIAVIIINVSPLITAVFARMFIDEKLTKKKLLGIVLTIIGVIVISV